MDPLSAVGLAGSVVGLIDVAVRSISALRALQQRWKAADLTISLLISQLITLRAALNQIEEWITTSSNADQHYQLVMDLGASLNTCKILLLFIDGKLKELDWSDNDVLSFESKIKAALQDKTVKECATHLANQSTALNLLLTVANCQSLSAQNALLQAKENREVLQLAKADSSSLISLRDSASFRSSLTATTEGSNLLDVSFDFDEELTATKVYRQQWIPLIRGAIRRSKNIRKRSVDPAKVVDVKILLAGQMGGRPCKLHDIMIIMCEDNYDSQVRRSFIHHLILDTTKTTLSKMAELSLPMEEGETSAVVSERLCQFSLTDKMELPEELGKALVHLWSDEGVKTCYKDRIELVAHPSATYFLDSITRVAVAGYTPTSQDAAMSLVVRTKASDSVSLPVMSSLQRHRFIKWTPYKASSRIHPEAPQRNLAYECAQLDAVLYVVDLADSNPNLTHSSTVDGYEESWQSFRRCCNFPWLVEKDIILMFLNFERLHPNMDTPDFKSDSGHAEYFNKIVEKFILQNEDDSRKVYVMIADNDVRSKNLQALDDIVEDVMSRRGARR